MVIVKHCSRCNVLANSSLTFILVFTF